MLVIFNQNVSWQKYETPELEILQVSAENGFADSEQYFDIEPYGEGINF